MQFFPFFFLPYEKYSIPHFHVNIIVEFILTDDISDAHNSDGNNPREKDGNSEDINVPEECTLMTTEKFQFVVLKLLKQIDKSCIEQFRELNRKLGSMSKRVGKLEKKVEAFGSTPATVVNSTHDEVKKYLKPATMEKFQDLEDMLKHSKFYNKLKTFFISLKGLSVSDSVYNMMYACLKDDFAMNFSYYGTKEKERKPGKSAFKDTSLCSCVYGT
ncbi:hypothetical protein QAD02_003363 [Eretmocerus hayati]|uniref:Uncharacterized protein n=1 Tax=Eretmocerus hayati TaxID=131215 RepID=A0ACC2NLX7_9HYME|nr:hypothetical protein QAD02_003363 [Eretmocerus hayati]